MTIELHATVLVVYQMIVVLALKYPGVQEHHARIAGCSSRRLLLKVA